MSELKGILENLKLVLEQNKTLGLKPLDYTTPSYSHELPPVAPLLLEADVYGRESDREDIVASLLSSDETGPRILVIPIVGMGGIGKTTLAHFVYNDVRVQERFDARVWVAVSDKFDVTKIMREILKAVIKAESDTADVFRLQTDLGAVLKGKRFLCVLDDVWNENYDKWYALKTPLESGSHGSKIIVTTRSLTAASMMGRHEMRNLKTMAEDKCLSLFEHHVFSDAMDNNGFARDELRKIGIEIVKKCKGLPMAVKAIAGLLRPVSDPIKWRSILESNLWDLQFQENRKSKILPALWLSYCNLSPHLKRCFAYFSIFPKDYEFGECDQEKLVLLWMAEGLLKEEGDKSMEDVGREYVIELISRSVFQQRSGSLHDDKVLVMHDLVHDLAMRVSGEFCNLLNLTNKTRHVSYDMHSKNELEGLFVDTKRLRTIVALPLSGNYWNQQIRSLPSFEGCLRALSLPPGSITELPCSMGNLKHLRYLDLSGTYIEEIPSSICTLYNLQTLLLDNCIKLKQLPTDTSRLINLRHLRFMGTMRLIGLPPNMNKMTSLQTLSFFRVCKGSGSRIKELGDLNFLRGRLEILGIENVVDVNDAAEAKLMNKDGIDELILHYDNKINGGDLGKQHGVLDALRPHLRLKRLEILGHNIVTLPNWVARRSFVDMTNVSLRSFSCTVLAPFGQLPSLKVLSLKDFSKLVTIGDEVYGDSSGKPFPRLEELRLYEMDSLEKWSFTSDTMIFPRLKKITVQSCKELNAGFPSVSLPALEYAKFRVCNAMVRVFDPTFRASYPSLESMEVEHCAGLQTLEGIESAPNLKRLKIRNCGALLTNCLSWDLSGKPFPRLEELSLQRIDKWSFVSETRMFHRLKKFTVGGGSVKLGFPSVSLPALEAAQFRNCNAMVRVFDPTIGASYPSLEYINIGMCRDIETLDGIESAPNLKHLEIWMCGDALFENHSSWDAPLQQKGLLGFRNSHGAASYSLPGCKWKSLPKIGF